MTIWHMRSTCWTPNAPDSHSEYVIFIAVPLQQWLHERASMLRLYVHCLPFVFWPYQESLDVVMSCKHNNAHIVRSTDCSIKF